MYHGTLRHNRVYRAINYAEEYCGGAIDLDKMADIACLSKYHFLRVFKETIGETPIGFLQRLRLERGARRLVFWRQTPIIDVALDCGFASPQSFSSAFSSRYGISPQNFRNHNDFHFRPNAQNRNLPEAYSRPLLLDSKTEQMLSNISIQSRKQCRVAYFRRLGPYAKHNWHQIFQVFANWAGQQGLANNASEIIGIPWDNPNLTPPANCRYDVCIEVPDAVTLEEPASLQIIPGGLYAVMPLFGQNDQIRHAWELATKLWLPQSGYQIEFRAGFEIFGASSDGREHLCRTIWLPLRRP